ncbi:hypothetical protein BCR42DRAFT_488966 [Absidia repens]|uniref:Uncharacterized protein n=1 Tax=Absidia repens TaxID=90262 RepID=A0A1X2IQC7_9FUNG|nr:hypothetical protein BCR42DRAFT_488966 [Absidia repens]
MMDVHGPLTPPVDHGDDDYDISKQQQQQQPSVKFDLSSITITTASEPIEHQQTIKDPQLPSPCIDISAHMVPDSILVALLDREQEMKGLVQHNLPFFQTVQQHIGPAQWPAFETVLYCDRQQLPDKEWMSRIEHWLDQVPSMVGTFKELVGYVEQEEEYGDDDDDDQTRTYNNQCSFLNHVDLSHIRQYPERLQAFKSSYPQFFINCQQVLSNDTMSKLETTLYTPKAKLSDDQWKGAIKKQLSPYPNLMDQLKEIIAYEVDDE